MNKLPPIAQKIALGSPITNSYIESIASGASLGRQSPMLRTIISTMFVLLMAKLNSYVVKNLLSRRQLMNASFDKLRLCSSYGAFGVVAETREELIIESADNIAGPWKEYHFRVKPGDINRRPPWISPYHYRLDWQMWIASQCGRVERSPWMYNFLLQLLRQEKDVIGLLESDPWASQQPISATATTTTGDNDDIRSDNDSESEESKLVHGPKYIRVEKYIYKFYNNKNGLANNSKCEEGIKNHQNKSQYWIRQRKGRYFPRQGIMTAEMLEELANGR